MRSGGGARRTGPSRRRLLRRTACALALGVSGVLIGRRGVAAAPSGFDGVFVLDPSCDGQARADAAIEAVLEDLPALLRGIARHRLKKTISIVQRFHFRMGVPETGKITISSELTDGWASPVWGLGRRSAQREESVDLSGLTPGARGRWSRRCALMCLMSRS